MVRARSVRIATRGRRPLPVHADGTAVGTTPVVFEIAPRALHVLTGKAEAGATCAWQESTGA